MNYSLLLRGALVVARKNMRIYYRKAPVYIFGLLLPAFLFFAFFIGRELDVSKYFPGFLAMCLFFTSSSVGPIIVPWEKQAGTFERLLSMPVTVTTIILGDMLAGALFGLFISAIVGVVGVILLGLSVTNIPLLVVLFLLGNACFAALGELLSSTGGRTPSNVMMLSSLVRFPLIFISGVFISLGDMTSLSLTVARFSPLAYLVDGMGAAMGRSPTFHWAVDVPILLLFTVLFVYSSGRMLRRNLMKGL
ncbi:MAG TPA: ABC transporter permease [Thermoplasmata archaeon]